MIRLYCRALHGGRPLCSQCQALGEYAMMRLAACPFAEAKPTCARCPIHCYRPLPRERIRDVMRFAGPRMLFRHPLLAFYHLLQSRKPIPARPRKTRQAA